MGVCADCMYHLANSQGNCFHGFRRVSGHQCVHPLNKNTDYITGEQTNGDCYELNNFEECPYFNNGKLAVIYYAWNFADEYVYTTDEKPTINSKLYMLPDVLSDSVIEEVPNFYAFRSSDNTLVFSKNHLTELSLGDKVYTSLNEELGEIEEISQTSITVGDVVYEYCAPFNKLYKTLVINGHIYARHSSEDISITKSETEEVEDDESSDTTTDKTSDTTVDDTTTDETTKTDDTTDTTDPNGESGE